jgi:hypothetical protein
MIPPNDDRQTRRHPFPRIVFVERTQRPVFRAYGDRVVVVRVSEGLCCVGWTR